MFDQYCGPKLRSIISDVEKPFKVTVDLGVQPRDRDVRYIKQTIFRPSNFDCLVFFYRKDMDDLNPMLCDGFKYNCFVAYWKVVRK